MPTLSPQAFAAQGGTLTQPGSGNLYSNYVNNIGKSNPVVQKFTNTPATPISPFNPNYKGPGGSQFVDPNKAQPGTTTGSKFMGSLIPAVGQVGADIATAIPKGLQYAGTRMAQAGVQTANEFQNPGYDTAVDTGNPQRSGAGGTVKANPTPTQTPQANTSNSEANINKSQTVLPQSIGGTVEPQQQGKAGVEQIGEQALGALNMVGTGALLQDPVEAVTSVRDAFKSAGKSLAGKFPELADTLSNLGDKISGLASNAGDKVTSALSDNVGATPETTGVQNNQKVQAAQAQLDTANQNYSQADVQAAQSRNAANASVQGDIGKGGALGKEFSQGLQDLETANPKLTATIPPKLAYDLNNLPTNTKFALPDFIKNQMVGKGTPTQIGDLISQLNNAAYDAKVNGDVIANQKYVDMAEQVKDIANQTFGKATTPSGQTWTDIYSNFKQGVVFRDTMDKVINFNPKADPFDMMQQTGRISKILETPGGQSDIQKMIDDYAQVRGMDKAEVIRTMIKNIQTSDAQQEIVKLAQTNLDAAVAQAEKGGFGKQFITALKNPQMLARRTVYEGVSIAVGATGVILYLKSLLKK